MQHDKISIAEALSNSSNGKTSGGKLIGSIISIVGLISFLTSLLFLSDNIYIVQILSACTALVFFGSGLIVSKIIKPTK